MTIVIIIGRWTISRPLLSPQKTVMISVTRQAFSLKAWALEINKWGLEPGIADTQPLGDLEHGAEPLAAGVEVRSLPLKPGKPHRGRTSGEMIITTTPVWCEIQAQVLGELRRRAANLTATGCVGGDDVLLLRGPPGPSVALIALLPPPPSTW